MLDPRGEGPRDGMEVLVEGGTIREVSDRPISSQGAERVDLDGRVLMPGLIDAHVHVIAAMANLGEQRGAASSSWRRCGPAKIMHAMLMRGFTTVRDVGGADRGLADAQALGVVTGPRLVISGKALSQSGGHCDSRQRNDDRPTFERVGSMGRLCDGVDAVRRAAREELRQGADFIKVMANGGIASPTDPIHMLQFSRAELEAAVEEAKNLGTYVSAHLYTDEAISRALDCGVHSLEHCNLITAATAARAAKLGAIAVPTLITYQRLAVEAASLGMQPESVAKIETVRQAGLDSLAIMREAGLPMAYGTDLLGEMHRHQSGEFALRARAHPAIEVLRSATTLAAELCGLAGPRRRDRARRRCGPAGGGRQPAAGLEPAGGAGRAHPGHHAGRPVGEAGAVAMYDVIVRGGTVVTADDQFAADVGVRDGRIAALAEHAGRRPGGRCVRAAGAARRRRQPLPHRAVAAGRRRGRGELHQRQPRCAGRRHHQRSSPSPPSSRAAGCWRRWPSTGVGPPRAPWWITRSTRSSPTRPTL